MKLTIIKDDDAVYVDKVCISGLDLSSLDPTISAVQWNGSKGWIEYYTDDNGNREPNLDITDISQFQNIIDMWNTANTKLHQANTANTI